MNTLFNLHKMHKDTVYPPEGWAFSYLFTEQQQPKIVLQRNMQGDSRLLGKELTLVIEKISHLATFCTKQMQKKNNRKCGGMGIKSLYGVSAGSACIIHACDMTFSRNGIFRQHEQLLALSLVYTHKNSFIRLHFLSFCSWT